MEKELKINDFFQVIKKYLWMIALLSVLTTAAGGFYSTYYTTPMYQSSTQILLHMDKPNPDMMNTLEVILKDPAVLDKVINQLSLNKSSDALNGQITFAENGSEVVKISVADSDPALAAKIANTTATVFIQQMGNILGIYDVKVLSEAKVGKNPIPINSKRTQYIGMSFAIGIILSVGLAILFDSLDDSVTSEREIEKLLELPILGCISKVNRKNTARKNKRIRSVIKGGTIGA
jgi:capsular polysaccharide biosynthesis protein